MHMYDEQKQLFLAQGIVHERAMLYSWIDIIPRRWCDSGSTYYSQDTNVRCSLQWRHNERDVV